MEEEDKDLLRSVITAAEYIYENLGCGHSETIYHNAMLHQLKKKHSCESEVIVPICLDGDYCGYCRCDIIVDKRIILELKAISKTIFLRTDNEVIQIKNYIKFTGIKRGLLINFPKNGGPIIKIPL